MEPLLAGPVNSTSTRELSITAGTGDVDFDNTVGATNALSKITIVSSAAIEADNTFTAGIEFTSTSNTTLHP